jgi:hypothetical protein
MSSQATIGDMVNTGKDGTAGIVWHAIRLAVFERGFRTAAASPILGDHGDSFTDVTLSPGDHPRLVKSAAACLETA